MGNRGDGSTPGTSVQLRGRARPNSICRRVGKHQTLGDGVPGIAEAARPIRCFGLCGRLQAEQAGSERFPVCTRKNRSDPGSLSVLDTEMGIRAAGAAGMAFIRAKRYCGAGSQEVDPDRAALVSHFEAWNNQLFIDKGRLRELGLKLSQIKEYLEAQPLTPTISGCLCLVRGVGRRVVGIPVGTFFEKLFQFCPGVCRQLRGITLR